MDKKKIVKKKKTVYSEAKKNLSDTIDIHYLKTNNYRTYHVDGIFGGITPDAKKVYLELFVQRSATPNKIEHAVTQEGAVGKETGHRVGKEGLVREIESGLIMDLEVAEILKKWLDKQIKSCKKSNINAKR